jgi:hypothetical protein
MEPDISILRKTGHFYFALTRNGDSYRAKSRLVLTGKVRHSPKSAVQRRSATRSLLCRSAPLYRA